MTEHREREFPKPYYDQPAEECANQMSTTAAYTPESAEKYRLDRLRHLFTYHAPKPGDEAKFRAIRTAAFNLADIIEQNAPIGQGRDNAIETLRMVVMLANAAIALNH